MEEEEEHHHQHRRWSPPESCRRGWPQAVTPESSITTGGDITFQQMDADHYIGYQRASSLTSALLAKRLGRVATQSSGCAKKKKKNSGGGCSGGAAVMRLYGVTASGQSVLAHVHGYSPYFYVRAPPGFEESMCDGFKDSLEKGVASRTNHNNQKKSRKRKIHNPIDDFSDEEGGEEDFSFFEHVISVEPCFRQTIWSYQAIERSKFLKISMSLPQHLGHARRVLESGISFPRY